MVAHRREDQAAGHRTDRGFGIVSRLVGDPLQVGPVGVGREDVVPLVDGPYVLTTGAEHRGRTVGVREVGRRVDDPLVTLQEVAASGASLAGTDEVLLAGREVEHENLVAGVLAELALHDQLGAVAGPVRLGVLAAERELPDILEEPLSGQIGDWFAGSDAKAPGRNDGRGLGGL